MKNANTTIKAALQRRSDLESVQEKGPQADRHLVARFHARTSQGTTHLILHLVEYDGVPVLRICAVEAIHLPPQADPLKFCDAFNSRIWFGRLMAGSSDTDTLTYCVHQLVPEASCLTVLVNQLVDDALDALETARRVAAHLSEASVPGMKCFLPASVAGFNPSLN